MVLSGRVNHDRLKVTVFVTQRYCCFVRISLDALVIARLTEIVLVTHDSSLVVQINVTTSS